MECSFSVREQYIIAQALHVAIETMGKVEPAIMREESNIADMKRLRESVFTFPAVAFERVGSFDTLLDRHSNGFS